MVIEFVNSRDVVPKNLDDPAPKKRKVEETPEEIAQRKRQRKKELKLKKKEKVKQLKDEGKLQPKKKKKKSTADKVEKKPKVQKEKSTEPKVPRSREEVAGNAISRPQASCASPDDVLEFVSSRLKKSKALGHVGERLSAEHVTGLGEFVTDFPGCAAHFVGHRKPKDPGCPKVIVLCSAALRCCELVKGLPVDCRHIKLFAKHIKLADQIEQLQSRVVDIAVGTPARVLQLLRDNAINTKNLTTIVMDGWQNMKKMTVMDGDTREAVATIVDEYVVASNSSIRVSVF